MKLLIALEQRFARGADGQFCAEGPANYGFWSRYLEVFDELVVLARVSAEQRACLEEARADGPLVSFCALPDYRGPWQYLRNLPELRTTVRQAVVNCDAYILRVPGLVGRLAWYEIRRLGKPYALEVVGDPWDALGPGTWPNVFRPIFRRAAARHLRAACQGAIAIHYVTQYALQRRYPPGKNAYTVGFSDALMESVFAPPAALDERYRRIEELTGGGKDPGKRFRIGFIGSLSILYKAPDVFLRAASLCHSRGLNFEIVLVGDGRYAESIKALGRQLGLTDRTKFLGQLPFGKAIFDLLDSVDLFVMPSRAEGLPRALLEAMARGCPCIGSEVGGIPELLAPVDIVPAGDAGALADKILDVAINPQLLKQMALRNLERARQFRPELLEEAHRSFLRIVRLHSEGAAADMEGPAEVRIEEEGHRGRGVYRRISAGGKDKDFSQQGGAGSLRSKYK
jgi:glycosyltransferase involved in cell wall biosynthesis